MAHARRFGIYAHLARVAVGSNARCSAGRPGSSSSTARDDRWQGESALRAAIICVACSAVLRQCCGWLAVTLGGRMQSQTTGRPRAGCGPSPLRRDIPLVVRCLACRSTTTVLRSEYRVKMRQNATECDSLRIGRFLLTCSGQGTSAGFGGPRKLCFPSWTSWVRIPSPAFASPFMLDSYKHGATRAPVVALRFCAPTTVLARGLAQLRTRPLHPR